MPSALYSLSYKPNPRWSRRYAEQPEILKYLQQLVESGGLAAHLRTQTEVVAMTFDDQLGRWTLVTNSNETITCDVVVSAVGQLSLPHVRYCRRRHLPGGRAFIRRVGTDRFRFAASK